MNINLSKKQLHDLIRALDYAIKVSSWREDDPDIAKEISAWVKLRDKLIRAEQDGRE